MLGYSFVAKLRNTLPALGSNDLFGERSLAPRLPSALRKMPKASRNLSGQTMAQLTREHDNLTAMMTFMGDEIG